MKKIAVVGDVVLDKYYYCSNRENPESSAPCYTVERTEHKLGGAGNVAANLKVLGAEFELISVVGNDENAGILRRILSELEIPHRLIEDRGRPTIVKTRLLSSIDGRYLFRYDKEKRQYISLNHSLEIASGIEADIILISDYNKGAISQDLIERLKKLKKPIIADAKVAHKDFYREIFLLKPNVKEVREMTKLEDEVKAAERLRDELSVRILLTRGEKGISYFGLERERHNFPALGVELVDVTGAGDVVIAAFTHFYAKSFDLRKCVELANIAGGISVQHPGCYAVSEREILEYKGFT